MAGPVDRARRGQSELVVEAEPNALCRQVGGAADCVEVVGKRCAGDARRGVYGDGAEIQIEVFASQRPIATECPLRSSTDDLSCHEAAMTGRTNRKYRIAHAEVGQGKAAGGVHKQNSARR